MYVGPLFILPPVLFSWKVLTADGITPASLLLPSIVHPKIDIVIIGTGSSHRCIPHETIVWLKNNKLEYETNSTPLAVKSYNGLRASAKLVAGAFLPLDLD
ncbi:NADH dehydrogenase [ubiquinone] 1 alpha subcomplex assembly factor 3 [Thelohanellus kitauei]|uniref:NADH dehydrogenase [ubiquinone] 1 alpha subcomplex assembly factor 3 n=1 Tax=Thelohanellus kitauei TaxID=669202 RepID=A0A0C2N0L5_THEKT|nr:NADH dehydrogenase [ubiquinone] 1 alpha subcomplex assembly factor 3 [Thelohanellus kitauei]